MKGVMMWQRLLLRLAVTLALVAHADAQTQPAEPPDQPQAPGDADPDNDIPDPRTAPKIPSAEYVKQCSLYGEGFFYVPGTDACLRLGGTLRLDARGNATGGGRAVLGGPRPGEPGHRRREN